MIRKEVLVLTFFKFFSVLVMVLLMVVVVVVLRRVFEVAIEDSVKDVIQREKCDGSRDN